jgi:hypothetical protein
VTREKWLDPSNWASLKPFGMGEEHPNNYLELWSAFKENRDQARYAWRILTQGVEPDLPMRIQRRELPASLDPHLAVGVPSPSAVIPGAAGPTSPVGHWTLTAAPEKALAAAAAVARQGRVDRGVPTSAPQPRQYPSWRPPTLVSASLSALVARSRLLV